jgi:hypothetical protein
MGIFNNREIATGIWLIIILILILLKGNIRKSLIKSLIESFFQLKILIIIFLIFTYVTVIISLLYFINFWDFTLLKDSIIFCFTAIVMSFNYATSNNNENLFRKIIVDSAKLIIIFEFIVNIYTFPLLVELIFLPVVTFIVLLEVTASYDKKYTAVSKFLKIVQIIIGISILIYSIYQITRDFKNFATFNTLKDFLLAPILTISFIPFIYIMILFINYEQIFVRLDLGHKKDEKLKKYSKTQIIKYCSLSLTKVKNVLSNNVSDLMNINNKEDVDNLIEELRFKKNHLSEEEN